MKTGAEAQQMDKEQVLTEIFNSDPFGLLDVKPKVSNYKSPDERLADSFHEINEFYKKYKREPKPDISNITEYQLYARLKSLREDLEKSMVCEPLDKYGLLKIDKKEINSIDDIFGDDNLGILNDDSGGLFDFKHIPKETNMPEYVASRKKCTDFHKFEILFKECQKDLRSGKRKLYPFKNEQQIAKGYFFVLKGILLYVAKVGKKSNEKGKMNARLRCVFENGTESDMLLRSLAAELYKHGRRITEHDDKLLDGLKGITEEDEESGHIYILKSLSKEPKIREIRQLFKIGYSSTPIEERIKNAAEEPTYLMAPVAPVSSFKCYNMNPQKLEQLLHNFFGNSCLNIDVFDKEGNRHTPREWFIVPLEIIEQAVEFIISGEIVHFRYDAEREIIIGK
jgi:hypothetical protein